MKYRHLTTGQVVLLIIGMIMQLAWIMPIMKR